MRTWRTGVWVAGMLVGGCSAEQVQLGQWYRLGTPANGACPALTWQFVFTADRSIGGNVSIRWTKIATLTGTLAPDDTFRMTATGQGMANGAANGTATITGRITSWQTTIAIAGDGLGAGCDGKTFQLITGRYYQSLSGGGGGGNN